MKQVSGSGVVLNTSFNLKDQTITMTPKQAVERFINSEINFLVIGNYLLRKK
jgi:carbamoyltransferase